MRRAYFHHDQREEFHPNGGMWHIANGPIRQTHIVAAAELMKDPLGRFLRAMMRAIDEWPNSCRTVMTADSMNHRAWFGHAGCYLETGSPEDCTRLGWHTLDEPQQRLANYAADLAIEAWKRHDLALRERDMLWSTSA